jgi:chromosome partitioning protein
VARVIALANQKGGVGKTTTTLNLGCALARRGRSVLLVDFDPQGSLTISAGIDLEPQHLTIHTVCSQYADARNRHPMPLDDVIIDRAGLGIHLAPTGIELANLERELVNAFSREHVLRRVLDDARRRYDYILIDCPPSLGLIVINALAAADELIIPLQADYLAMKGVNLLLDTVNAVRDRLNATLVISGIVMTLVDQRTMHARQVIETTRASFAGKIPVYTTYIKTSVRLKEAPIAGQSILNYDPTSDAALAYQQLAEEVDHAW